MTMFFWRRREASETRRRALATMTESNLRRYRFSCRLAVLGFILLALSAADAAWGLAQSGMPMHLKVLGASMLGAVLINFACGLRFELHTMKRRMMFAFQGVVA